MLHSIVIFEMARKSLLAQTQEKRMKKKKQNDRQKLLRCPHKCV